MLTLLLMAAALWQTPPPNVSLFSVGKTCSAYMNATNKVVTTTCTADGKTLFGFSFNPRMLEGNGGAMLLSIKDISIMYQHNLPTDPLTYSVASPSTINGNSSTATTILTSCGGASQVPCPMIPW